jgi:hypothetical protein
MHTEKTLNAAKEIAEAEKKQKTQSRGFSVAVPTVSPTPAETQETVVEESSVVN